MNIGFFSLCFLVLLAMKLMGYFAYSWWLVFFPLYAPLLVIAMLSSILGFVVVLKSKPRGEDAR